MKNGLFTFDWGMIGDAVVTAVFFAVLAALYQVATAAGFNVFSADWGMIGRAMTNVGFTAGVVSLTQAFISTNKGSVLNITPEVKADTQS